MAGNMKIVFVGNGNFRFAGLRHFGYDTRIFNGLVRNGHCVYLFSDRDELRQLSPLGLFRKKGRARANEKLLKVVDNIRPDALVLVHVDTIGTETYAEIRRRHPGIRIAQINVDPLFNPTNRANLLRRAPMVDATFVTSGGPALSSVTAKGKRAYFLPNFTDSSIDTGTAFADAEPRFDVACFMHADTGMAGDEAERLALANGVASGVAGVKTCYGGFNGAGSIRGRAYYDSLAQSAMGLNLSKHFSNEAPSTPETRYLYSSDRIAHFMGNGCLTFTQRGFALEEIYAEDEVVYFEGLADLVEKVDWHKRNPAQRQAAARKGWERAHGPFETTNVMKYMLEQLFERPLTGHYPWPVTSYAGAA